MLLNHRPYKLFITGMSGYGKTIYWSNFVLGWRGAAKFIFDFDGQFAFRHRIRAARVPAEIDAAAARGFCVYDPATMFPGERMLGFAFFCEYASTMSAGREGRKLFACDELQQCVGDERTCQELQEVLENGRIKGLDFAAITIAPNLVHNRIRGQATEVVTFRQGTAEALPWLALRGFDKEAVMALPRGHYIARGESGGETRGRVF